MPIPLFSASGRLLFCNGSLAASCCTPAPKVLTITLYLVDNAGVYNQVSFSYGGAKWGNNCASGNPPAGVAAGSWSSSFDLSILGQPLSVTILADCHYYHAGDVVGHVSISATLTQGTTTLATATGSLTPSPVYEDSSSTYTVGCAGADAASATVAVTTADTIVIT